MSPDDAVLIDIARAARNIVEFVASVDRQGFFADIRTQAPVQHQLLLIGEAAKRPTPASARQIRVSPGLKSPECETC